MQRLEDGFRSQKAGRDRNACDLLFPKLGGEIHCQPDGVDFREVVIQIAAIVEAVAVGDLDDQAILVFNHQRDSVMRVDDVRVDPRLQNLQSDVQRDVPRALPLIQRIAVDVVDENVETPLLAFNPIEKLLHFVRLRVIDANSDSDSTLRTDHLRGLVDCLRPLLRDQISA